MTSHLEDSSALLAELIAFPTVSDRTNLPMIEHLANRLSDAGARVDIFPDDSGQKGNLFATLGPEEDGGIVLSGHSDVVPVTDQVWTDDPFTMVEKDGRLYGRGSCDMKGFIAIATTLAPLYAERVRNRPLHFAFTYDEEIGCFGAQSLVTSLQAKGITPALAIIGEPTSMRVIEGHKGCYEYTTQFTGQAGHGSAPDLGVNAVEFAARYVARILELKEELRHRAPKDSRFVPPWTTLNTGALHGGIAHNVIPSQARVDWDMRPVQISDADYVKSNLQDYCEKTLLPEMQAVFPEADITTETLAEVQGLEPATQNEARDILMELTGANGTDLVAFGTEAGLFQSMGMSAVVCGPGSIEQAHKPDEFVSLSQMQHCVTMLEKLSDRL